MSWGQGVQVREDLPERFVAWADRQKGGAKLEYITWFEGDRETVYLDYGEAGSLTMRLNPRNAGDGGMKIEVSSGNVFADLGLPNPDVRLALARMMVEPPYHWLGSSALPVVTKALTKAQLERELPGYDEAEEE